MAKTIPMNVGKKVFVWWMCWGRGGKKTETEVDDEQHQLRKRMDYRAKRRMPMVVGGDYITKHGPYIKGWKDATE